MEYRSHSSDKFRAEKYQFGVSLPNELAADVTAANFEPTVSLIPMTRNVPETTLLMQLLLEVHRARSRCSTTVSISNDLKLANTTIRESDELLHRVFLFPPLFFFNRFFTRSIRRAKRSLNRYYDNIPDTGGKMAKIRWQRSRVNRVSII